MILESILLSFIPGLTIMGVNRWLKDPEYMDKYENEFIKIHQEANVNETLIPSGFNNDDTQFLLHICAEAQKLGKEDDERPPEVQHHHIGFKKVSHPPVLVEMIRCSAKFAVMKAPQAQAAYLLRKGKSDPKIPTDIFFFRMKFLYYKRNLTPEEVSSRLEKYNAHLNASHINKVHHLTQHSPTSTSSTESVPSEEYDFSWLFGREDDEENSSPVEELTTVPQPESKTFDAEERDVLKSKPRPNDDHNQPALFQPVDIETLEKENEVETSKLMARERAELVSHSPLSMNLETVVEKSYQPDEGKLSDQQSQRAKSSHVEDTVQPQEIEGIVETEFEDSKPLPRMGPVMLGGRNDNLSEKTQVLARIQSEESEPSRLPDAKLASADNKKDTLESILAGTFSEESYYKNLMLKLNERSWASASQLDRAKTEELYGARWNRSMARQRKRFPSHPYLTNSGIPITVS